MASIEFNYGSYTELVEAVLTASPNATNYGVFCHYLHNGTSGHSDPSWYGWKPRERRAIKDLAHFFFVEGWPEGEAKMQRDLKKIKAPVVQSIRRKRTWGAENGEISRERLYAGQIDTMYRTSSKQLVNTPSKVKIAIDIATSSDRSTDEMFWRGAAAMTLLKALTEAGYSVELSVIHSSISFSGKYSYQNTIIVKKFEQPLNFSACLAMTAHASFMRSLCLAHRYGKLTGRHSAEHMPNPPDTSKQKVPGVLLLLATNIWTVEAANTWVQNMLKKITTKK